jgi:membrane-bound lytic murein transglycosylase F
MRTVVLVVTLCVVCHGTASAWQTKSARSWQKKYTTKYDQYFKKYSQRFFGAGFKWQWFKAQAVAESDLIDKAESWLKAKGIMQIMPATFDDLKKGLPADVKKELPSFSDIHDPRWNIAAGIYYDHYLMRNFWKAVEPDTERLSFTFASYNAGAGTLQKAQETAKKKGLVETLWDSIVAVASEVPRWRHKETLNYVQKIKDLVEEVDR